MNEHHFKVFDVKNREQNLYSRVPGDAHHRQAGSAMMETVISLFVLAIGLMGTLAMQATGINSNQRANFATDANILAGDMADRILAFTRSVDPGQQLTAATLKAYDGVDTRTAASTTNCATACSIADQIKFDLSAWSNAIKTSLPEGVGLVKYDTTLKAYEIQVMWNHNRVEKPTYDCKGAESDAACFSYILNLE